METIFLQPRHIYAPENGDGHIHLSSSLVTAVSRIKTAGSVREISIRDENFDGNHDQGILNADTVGITIVGAPYIEAVRQIISRRVRDGSTVLLGGQILGGFSDVDFNRLFNQRKDITVLNGNADANLQEVFDVGGLPSQEDTSSISTWETIPDDQWRQYLATEFSFYVSQGCKYRCSFCQAASGRPEKYRNQAIMEKDMEWLANKAKSLGINEISFYASNLDVFQTPNELAKFADSLQRVMKKTGIQIKWRGLATVKSFIGATPELIKKIYKSGFVRVGLGIDGISREVWESIRKTHNGTIQQCEEALKKVDSAGFTPEILMVYGHSVDTRETMEATNAWCLEQAKAVGAEIRVHMGKPREMAKSILEHPEYCTSFDYMALASTVSHGSDLARNSMLNRYFMELNANQEGAAKWVYPNAPEWEEFASQQGTTIQKLNEGRFDR